MAGEQVCPHPGDPATCEEALVKAWRDGNIERHCVMEGLRSGLHQCYDVLLRGLRLPTIVMSGAAGPGSAQRRRAPDLQLASEAALLLGCSAENQSFWDLLCDAHHRLIRSVAARFARGKQDDHWMDDVCQKVFVALWKHFLHGRSVAPGCLRSFVVVTTTRVCLKRPPDTPPEQTEPSSSPSPPPPPPGPISAEAVEAWDEIDQQLVRLGNGIIDRLIIAQMGVGGVFSVERYWPRELVADWQRLTQCPEDRLLCLRAAIADCVRRFPSQRPMACVATAINSGAASFRELPVLFAAATGMSLPETKNLISEICALSKNAVDIRLSRIRRSIHPPDTGGSEGTA